MGTFVAGWDGGGTKTKAVCLAADGSLFAQATFGALNPNGAPKATVLATVTQALRWMDSLGECSALVISVAGVSNPETAELIPRLLAENGYHGPYQVVGDQESALYGAVGNVGAVLVSGTGSICFGRNSAGETARCGGYGYLVDDVGSGYAIGRDILVAVLQAEDGRTPPTILTELLFSQAGWNGVPALMQNLYGGQFEKSRVAALAPLLLNAGADPAALTIIENAARDLTQLAATVIDRLQLQQERLALTGSILEHIAPVRSLVEANLTNRYPQLLGYAPIADAAHGAAQMALQQMRKGT